MAAGRGLWKQLKWLCYGFLLGFVAWLSWRALRPDSRKEGFISLDSLSGAADLAGSFLGVDLGPLTELAEGVSTVRDILGEISPSTNCDKTMIGTQAVWLCPDDEKAAAVAKTNPADRTCVPDGMIPVTFYCNDAYSSDNEAAAAAMGRLAPKDMIQKDHQKLCRDLYKNFFDMSGNVGSVAKINEVLAYAMRSVAIDISGVKDIRTKLKCGASVVPLEGITDPITLQATRVCNKSFQVLQILQDGLNTLTQVNLKLNDPSSGGAPLDTIKRLHALLRLFVKQFNCR